MKYNPHDYQQFALDWMLKLAFANQAGVGLLLDPGLGKTAITLAWIRVMKALGLIDKVLIIAPLRVVYSVWPAEVSKWDEFSNFRVSIVHGSPAGRKKALQKDADIYLINPEGLVWLLSHLKGKIPFDALVVDESSKFKAWSAKRTKALRKVVPEFTYRIILTGTPSPNSLEDLFAQIYVLDAGEALGTAVSHFRSRYFYRGGYGGYKWIPMETSQSVVEKKIEHLCLRLAAEDHLDLPDKLINDVMVDLPALVRDRYKKLERELFMELDTGKAVAVSNAGVKYLACRQVANGGLYNSGKAEHIHNTKVDVVLDLVDELQGKPALIAFQFRHDLDRLNQIFPKLPVIDGRCPAKRSDELIRQWNAGELRVLAVQPQSLSHGVNMQAGPGRDIIWLGLTDNLETYLQLNARIYRQGVTGQVRIHRILARATVDVPIRQALENKDSNQQALLNALKQYRGSQM